MKILTPLAAFVVLLATAASVHPQPYDRGPPPPRGDYGYPDAPPPPLDEPPPVRMICYVTPPIPFMAERCPTHPGYPGSPCRCAGSFFDGEREYAD